MRSWEGIETAQRSSPDQDKDTGVLWCTCPFQKSWRQRQLWRRHWWLRYWSTWRQSRTGIHDSGSKSNANPSIIDQAWHCDWKDSHWCCHGAGIWLNLNKNFFLSATMGMHPNKTQGQMTSRWMKIKKIIPSPSISTRPLWHPLQGLVAYVLRYVSTCLQVLSCCLHHFVETYPTFCVFVLTSKDIFPEDICS